MKQLTEIAMNKIIDGIAELYESGGILCLWSAEGSDYREISTDFISMEKSKDNGILVMRVANAAIAKSLKLHTAHAPYQDLCITTYPIIRKK